MFLFSINSWTQKKAILENEKNTDKSANDSTLSDNNNQKKMRVVQYHVEETVPLKFGGYKTMYDVSSQKLIQTYSLGPDGKRIVTPILKEEPTIERTSLKADTILKVETSKITVNDAPKKVNNVAYIDIIKTYERVTDKGFESIDMLKKVANAYFFNDDLEKAEKCYTKLFSKTSDLEPEFYYRYAISLKAIGEIDKSKEYLKKFNELSSKDTR